MRRSTVLSTFAMAASTLVLAQPASAVPPLDDDPPAARAGTPTCSTGMVIATDDRRVRYDVIEQDKVVSSRPSKGKLPFNVDAWGYFDDVPGKKTDVFKLNAVNRKGERQVSLSFTGNKKIGLSSFKYGSSSMKPRLFADGYTYYAYVVSKKGELQRWTLVRYRDGTLRYAKKVVLAKDLRDLTSLQATTVFTLKGVAKEVLYGTTSGGGLLRFTVPLGKPAGTKTRTILAGGLPGVITELSWSTCNRDLDYTSLVGVDPVSGDATWITVKDSNTRPEPTVRGAIRGGDFTGVTALL